MIPEEAATVMLVRDAPRLETFMMRRNPRSAFVPGAHVFPGGKVDPADADPAVRSGATGPDDAVADARLDRVGARRFWVAAVREAFEEAGVLLARRADGSVFVPDPAERIGLEQARRRVLSAELPLGAVLAEHDLVLDLAALVPLAHWITPEASDRRYDTWFFVAHAPAGYDLVHADGEMVDSDWLAPDEVLRRAQARRIDLIYPTVRTLLLARRFPTADAFVDAVHDRWTRPDPWRVMNPDQGWQLDLVDDDEHRADDRASGFVMGMELPLGGIVPTVVR